MTLDDDALDGALRTLDPAARAAAPASTDLDRMISDARRQSPPRRLTRRVRAVIAAAAGLALVGGTAIAGTSYQDYLMHREPYAGIDPGSVRTEQPIRWVPAVGPDRGEHCGLYLDLSGIDGAQLRSVESFAASKDWTGVSAEVLAHAQQTGAISPGMTGADVDSAYGQAERDRLISEFSTPLPGLVWGGFPHSASQPALTAYTVTCRGQW